FPCEGEPCSDTVQVHLGTRVILLHGCSVRVKLTSQRFLRNPVPVRIYSFGYLGVARDPEANSITHLESTFLPQSLSSAYEFPGNALAAQFRCNLGVQCSEAAVRLLYNEGDPGTADNPDNLWQQGNLRTLNVYRAPSPSHQLAAS